MEDAEEGPRCGKCYSLLTEPYIQCVQCTIADGKKVTLCLHCFAKGLEFGTHESNHSYCIVKNNFPVFENGWTALEEMQLVKAVAECGYGNWLDVSYQLRTKSVQECQRHYNLHYVDSPQSPLPELTEQEQSVFPQPVVFKLSEDPPRPPDGSTMCTEMAGYMAARGDFTMEHDNYIEVDLRHVSFDGDEDEDDVEHELKLAVLDIYHRCLLERHRRKRIVRKYGLINTRNVINCIRRYDKTIKHLLDGLRVFMRLMSPERYDMFLESLHYEQELKQAIQDLQEYHENGITYLRNVKLYKMLKSRRDCMKSERHLLNDVVHHLKDEAACQSWLQRQAAIDTLAKGGTIPLPSAPRKSAPPLDVVGMPGYDKLNPTEKALCANVRLVPEAYHEFKLLLINECKKLGCLKLAQARNLIKIDVNKTRKIFDFLCSEGYINKDPL